jgi:hypothetical protein
MVKSILKKSKKADKPKKRKGISWNETEISEYDKTRGQTMKIDDPPTPFHYPEPKRKPKKATALSQKLSSKLGKVKKS